MIRKRLLIGFVLVTLLPVIGIGIGTIFVSYQNGRAQSLDRLTSVAARKELSVDGLAQSLRQELLFLSQTDYSPKLISTVLSLANEGSRYSWYTNLVRKRLQGYISQSSQLDELFLVDLSGKIVVSTDSSLDGEIYADQALFEQSLAAPTTRLPVVSDSPVLGTNPIITLIPMVDPEGAVIGVLGGESSVSPLQQILDERTGLGATGKTYLDVRSSSSPVAVQAPLPQGAPVTNNPFFNQPKLISPLEAGRTTVGRIYLDQDGVRVIGLTRELAGLGASLIVEQDLSEAFQAVYVTVAINLVIALGAVIVSVLASLLVTRSLADPIIELAETATQISRGHLDQTAKFKRDDEIGALALAFNSMTAQLRDLISSLERRVEERTHALQKAKEALEQRALQLETSAKVGREITLVLDLDVLLSRVVELIQESFGYYHVQVLLLDPEAGQLVIRASSGSGVPPHRAILLSEKSINGKAALTGKPVLANNVLTGEDFLYDEQLPETCSELAVPLRLGDQVIGTLDIQHSRVNAFKEEDIQVLQGLGDQIVIAIENAHLYDQSRELAILGERNRLARELHDSVTQSLYSLVLLTEGWKRVLNARGSTESDDYFTRIGAIAQQALKEMRLLIHELRPPDLEQEGLVGALSRRIEAVEKRVGIEARVVMEEYIELSPKVEDGLYRVALEALNNALKHAGAQREMVRICISGAVVVLEVNDDGCGFDPQAAERKGGMGLNGMRERIRSLGGTLAIESAIGSGATIIARVPLPAKSPDLILQDTVSARSKPEE